MADPIVVKVSALPELNDLATGDLITAVDISESIAANKTKKLQAGNLKVFTSTQITDATVTAAKLSTDAVETAKIKDLNVTTGKLADLAVTAAKIADATITPAKTTFAPTVSTNTGVARFNGTTGTLKDTSTFKIGDSGQVTLSTTASPAMYLDGMDSLSTHYSLVCRDGSAVNRFWVRNDGLVWIGGALQIGTDLSIGGNISVSGGMTGVRHVVYMQLFLPDEAIITTTAKTQFFVPSHLAGGIVKQLGIGIVSSSTGKTVGASLGSSYGSVSGVTSAETANTLNYTLPGALTKIPINVTCTAGDPAPKGLDFWFVVLK